MCKKLAAAASSGNKRIVLGLLVTVLVSQFLMRTMVFAEGDRYIVSVLDGRKTDYTLDTWNPLDAALKTVSEDGKSIAYEKNFGLGDSIPVLYGSSIVDIDLLKQDIVTEVFYRFIKSDSQGSIYSDPEFLEVNLQETFFPDLMKDYKGYLTARHYDVSALGGVGDGRWHSKANVFRTPMSSIRFDVPAHVSHTWNTGNKPYASVSAQANRRILINTNTVFTDRVSTGNVGDLINGGNDVLIYNGIRYAHSEASKFWGYISPPETGTYYIGLITDDGVYSHIYYNDEKVVLADFFVRNDKGWNPHFQDFVSTNRPLYLEKGEFYPFYLEYWNWGGSAQIRMTYTEANGGYRFNKVYGEARAHNFGSEMGFNDANRKIVGVPVAGQSGTSQSGSLRIYNAVPNYTSSQVYEMSSGWFYPSANTVPGETAEAQFTSTAKEGGIPFPREDGIYLLEVQLKMQNGNTETVVLGPFEIYNEIPVAFIEISPNYYTNGSVSLTLKNEPTRGSYDLRVTEVEAPGKDGNTTKALYTNKVYTAELNGRYTFYYEYEDDMGETTKGHVSNTVEIIDRIPPDITDVLRTDNALAFKVKDKTGMEIWEAIEDKDSDEAKNVRQLDSASGAVNITSLRRQLPSGAWVNAAIPEKINDTGIEAGYSLNVTPGDVYEITVRDLVGNTAVHVIASNQRPPEPIKPGLTSRNSEGMVIHNPTLASGIFQLPTVLSLDIQDIAIFDDGNIEIRFESDRVSDFVKALRITGSAVSGVSVGADNKSLVISREIGEGSKTIGLHMIIDPNLTVGTTYQVNIASDDDRMDLSETQFSVTIVPKPLKR